MAYKAGELRRVGECPHIKKDDGECAEYECRWPTFDSRREDGVRLVSGAFLPHSCDEWVIGGPVEIRALIADLQAALEISEVG